VIILLLFVYVVLLILGLENGHVLVALELAVLVVVVGYEVIVDFLWDVGRAE